MQFLVTSMGSIMAFESTPLFSHKLNALEASR